MLPVSACSNAVSLTIPCLSKVEGKEESESEEEDETAAVQELTEVAAASAAAPQASASGAPGGVCLCNFAETLQECFLDVGS